MNSVKNAIVTMTLLAVGYGAYVVLNNPAPESLDELAASDAWTAPDVSTGPDSTGVDISVPDDTATPPVEFPPPSDINQTAPPATDMADPGAGEVGSFAPPPLDEPGQPSADEPATEGDSSRGDLATTPTSARGAAAPDDAAGQNYYAAESSYPNTGAPELPLSGPNTPQGAAAPAASADDDSGFETTWQSVQADLQSGQLGNALLALSAWYGEPSLSAEQQGRCMELLDQLAGTVIYSRESYLEPAYVARQGETLSDLAAEFQVPLEFLARINGIQPPYELYSGESLKVVRGPFRAEVDRQQGGLTLFLGQSYAGRFAARCGAALPTGVNSFEVISIEPGRAFFDARSGNRVQPGQPENPYGLRWIGLRGDQITAAHNVGIHVDQGDSEHVCIAVSAVDADDLSAILTIGSRITIR